MLSRNVWDSPICSEEHGLKVCVFVWMEVFSDSLNWIKKPGPSGLCGSELISLSYSFKQTHYQPLQPLQTHKHKQHTLWVSLMAHTHTLVCLTKQSLSHFQALAKSTLVPEILSAGLGRQREAFVTETQTSDFKWILGMMYLVNTFRIFSALC